MSEGTDQVIMDLIKRLFDKVDTIHEHVRENTNKANHCEAQTSRQLAELDSRLQRLEERHRFAKWFVGIVVAVAATLATFIREIKEWIF